MKWQLTDFDNQQYGRFIKDRMFEFKEFDRHSENLLSELEQLGEKEFYDIYFNIVGYWVQETIDLNDYTIEQQRQYCLSYYPDNEFESLTDWIIAECIFEQNSGLY